MPQLLPGKGWLRKAYLNMKNIMGKHHGKTSYHTKVKIVQTKVKVVSGKFAMGKRVERDGLVQPIRAELCHGKMCYTYTLFNKATNGLLVRIVGLVNCVCFGYPIFVILPLH